MLRFVFRFMVCSILLGSLVGNAYLAWPLAKPSVAFWLDIEPRGEFFYFDAGHKDLDARVKKLQSDRMADNERIRKDIQIQAEDAVVFKKIWGGVKEMIHNLEDKTYRSDEELRTEIKTLRHDCNVLKNELVRKEILKQGDWATVF